MDYLLRLDVNQLNSILKALEATRDNCINNIALIMQAVNAQNQAREVPPAGNEVKSAEDSPEKPAEDSAPVKKVVLKKSA